MWNPAEFADANVQAYTCASDVHYTQFLVQKPLETAIATDKGWCHGLPLQTTLMMWDWNFAAVAPPMVASSAKRGA